MLISLIISADITDSYGFNVLSAQLKRLKDKGVETRLFYIFYNFNEYYPQSVVDDLVKYCKGSDLIGISLLSSAYRNSTQITAELRKHIGCPIIWGGKHPSAAPEDCLGHADMVCLGEGEDTLLEVVQNTLAGTSLDGISGLWLKRGQEIIRNPNRPLETNLDQYLFPDYSLDGKCVLDTKETRIRPIEDRDMDHMRRWYPTMITRGCPNCCTFCTNSSDRRMRVMRSRSIDNLFQEIKGFLNKYPDTQRVFLRDDCITAMPLDWVRDLSTRWKKEIGLPVSCSGVIATSEDFKEKIRLLTEAGFVGFKMGIQSGCERVRRLVYARVDETNEVIRKGASVLNALCRNKINYYMITDNPYETEDELVQSIRFTSSLPRPFSLSLYSLNFYPGTPLFRRALKDGYLKDKESALQESTMDFDNTYLNKVFISLRFFEIPPFLVKLLTNRRLYSSRLYSRLYNWFFHWLFKTNTPNRWIRPPKSPFKKRRIPASLRKTLRWSAWHAIGALCHYFHKLTVKPMEV